MKKKAFVTGAAGFLGINLVHELLEKEWTAANTQIGKRYHEKQYLDNVRGTKNILACAMQKRINKFIYTSSISA